MLNPNRKAKITIALSAKVTGRMRTVVYWTLTLTLASTLFRANECQVLFLCCYSASGKSEPPPPIVKTMPEQQSGHLGIRARRECLAFPAEVLFLPRATRIRRS